MMMINKLPNIPRITYNIVYFLSLRYFGKKKIYIFIKISVLFLALIYVLTSHLKNDMYFVYV